MKRKKVTLNVDMSLLTDKELNEYNRTPKSEQEKWKMFKGIEQAVSRNENYFNNLIISSFGIDNGSQPKGSRAFDCRRLNMRGHGLDLKSGRGCDDEFQKIAEDDHEFKEFIYLVAKCVLENSLQNISFYCSKGHHRSVAAATLFRDTFAKEAKIYHTCLKK
jgi:RNase adaptor protein for sRNA GlmZ degradation